MKYEFFNFSTYLRIPTYMVYPGIKIFFYKWHLECFTNESENAVKK
jgi:hypothetical protein